jgi:hypothetical protein
VSEAQNWDLRGWCIAGNAASQTSIASGTRAHVASVAHTGAISVRVGHAPDLRQYSALLCPSSGRAYNDGDARTSQARECVSVATLSAWDVLLRRATAADAEGVAGVYLRSWNEGFADLMPPRVLDHEQVALWELDLGGGPVRWWLAQLASRSSVLREPDQVAIRSTLTSENWTQSR